MILLSAALLLATAAGAVDMSAQPRVGPMKPYAMPAREAWRLDNGMEVVLVEDRRVPVVTARLAFRGGEAAVPARDAGLAEALAELLTDGTAKRSSKEISDEAEGYGGVIGAQAEPDAIVLGSYCLSDRLERMLGLMAEVARSPSLPQAEFDLRKSNMQEELNLNRSSPEFLAEIAFHKRYFAGHPYARKSPTDASIARLTRDGVAAAAGRLVTPAGAVLVIVGDAGRVQVRALVERVFGDWKGAPPPADAEAFKPAAAPRRAYLMDRPGSVQAMLILAGPAMRQDHPDFFSLLIANQVMGGSFSSRLVQDIREEKGYTYRIGSRFEHLLSASMLRVRTPLRNEVVRPALEGILGHLERLRKEPIGAEELEKAKTYLLGNFVRSMETQRGVADAVLEQKFHRLPEDYYDTYVRRVQGVSSAEALKAAQRYIRPEQMTLIAVGDAAAIKAALTPFSSGPVTLVDKDGD